MEDLSNLRQSYLKSELPDQGLPESPFELFGKWLEELKSSGTEIEINPMTLSTLGLDGFPKSRVVLLKSYDEESFVFFSNYDSEKGRAISAHPKVGLSFFWPKLERQVIIKGDIVRIPEADSVSYFESRPRGSQLGALVSAQSQEVANREVLEEKLKVLEKQFENQSIPKPQYWGGYKVIPISIEFWQGRDNRLHDRMLYFRDNNSWSRKRLQP